MSVPRAVGAAVIVLMFLGGSVLGRGLAAQTIVVGPQLAVGEYREVAAELSYQGAGLGAGFALTHRKLSLEMAYVRLHFEPDGGAAVEPFDAGQFDLRFRYAVTGVVSAEAGVSTRVVDPEFAAQSVGAARLGVALSNEIGQGVRLGLRGAYLAGGRFSGGGSAPLGVEIGLGVTGSFLRARLRIAADYEFQYFNRKTDDGSGQVSVPIQQALLRLGMGIGF